MSTITQETKKTALHMQETAGRAELVLKAAHIIALESCEILTNVDHESDRSEIVRELIQIGLSFVLQVYNDAMTVQGALGYPENPSLRTPDHVEPAPPKLTEPRRRQPAAVAA